MATDKEKPSLKPFSDDELKSELARRAEERRQAALKERADHVSKVVQNIKGLLPLLHHSRTSCTDRDPSNADRGCARCFALEVERSGWMDQEYTLEVHFDHRPIG